MLIDTLIAVDVFCMNHNIDLSFISSLQQNGLVSIITIDEKEFLTIAQLPELEKIIRLYYELDINLEGIEAITHLLDRMNTMNNENISLQNNLNLYDTE